MTTYTNIKSEIRKIVLETNFTKSELEGGFGRAIEESWLGAVEIDNLGPSFLTKFMAALAILKLEQEFDVKQDIGLREIALYLLGKLSEADKKSLSSSCQKNILSDAKEIYEFNWFVIHNNFLNET